jgi:5,6,7,8-tetrahydromethanopterin hydro-lyase
MSKVDKVLVGESLVGDGTEIAHISLVVRPRGSPAR